jgi:hypothetical protein
MKRWNISSAALIVLGFMVVLMLLIVVLPDDVDLPDTAFHRGTAPILVHSQATSPPVVVTVVAAIQLPDTAEVYGPFYKPGALALSPPSNSRPILLRSIRR